MREGRKALFSRADAKIGVSKTGPDAAARAPQAATIASSYCWGIVGVTLGLVALQLNMVVPSLVILWDLGGSLADVGVNSAIEVPAMIAAGYVALRLRKEVVLSIACAAYFLGVATATSVLQVMLLQGIAAVAIAALLSINISYLRDAIKGRVGLSTSLVKIGRVVAVLAASGIFALNVRDDFAPLLVLRPHQALWLPSCCFSQAGWRRRVMKRSIELARLKSTQLSPMVCSLIETKKLDLWVPTAVTFFIPARPKEREECRFLGDGLRVGRVAPGARRGR